MDLDTAEAICREVNSARLSRYEIVDILYKDGFEEVAVGKLIMSWIGIQLTSRFDGQVNRWTGRFHWKTKVQSLQNHL